jgi:hypothetical protein
VGRFDEVVRWATQTLAHPERLKPTQAEEFQSHLRLYEKGWPFRSE